MFSTGSTAGWRVIASDPTAVILTGVDNPKIVAATPLSHPPAQ